MSSAKPERENVPGADQASAPSNCSLKKTAAVQFLDATKAMMDALDKAAGLSAHQLRCFHYNFQQFTSQMVEEAEAAERQAKYPMSRHDWGAHERSENDDLTDAK